jgi:peptide/nickel transport system ATP-binding protein
MDLLAEVGIADPAGRYGQYPHQFSGGMRQRIVIALAIAAEPDVIVADEPTTALDVSVQAQILSLLRRLARDHGTAIVLVTHDMGVIAEIADRVAVMYAGRIVEIGPVTEVLHAARHPYTAGLMGLIPSLSRRADRLPQIAGSMPRPGQWPVGCSFHPRCPSAGPRCAADVPRPLSADGGMVACHLFSGGTLSPPAP